MVHTAMSTGYYTKPRFVGRQIVRYEATATIEHPPPLLATCRVNYHREDESCSPLRRKGFQPPLDPEARHAVNIKMKWLHNLCSNAIEGDTERVRRNLEACSLPLDKYGLLRYMRHGEQVDTEQAVAMVIAFLQGISCGLPDAMSGELENNEKVSSAIRELIMDKGVTSMLERTDMWREQHHFEIARSSREVSFAAKKKKVLELLGHHKLFSEPTNLEFVKLLQSYRRRRRKCNNFQHFTLPAELIPEDSEHKHLWSHEQSYRAGYQKPVPDDKVRLLSKRQFRKIQWILESMFLPAKLTSRFMHDVDLLLQKSMAVSTRRVDALDHSEDPFAIAYGFIAAQRHFESKQHNDYRWHQFQVSGEEPIMVQNMRNVLTSFEDILVRHATDSVALAAITCPPNLRGRFSTQQDLQDRVFEVCEMMERFVKDFNGGKTERHNVYIKGRLLARKKGGPIQCYNQLCEELWGCGTMARHKGMNLEIGQVCKVTGRDFILPGDLDCRRPFDVPRVPGWVDYLARVRAKETATKWMDNN